MTIWLDESVPPVELSTAGLTYLTEGSLAYAGMYRHERDHAVHTHSFLEIVVVFDGEGVHHCLAGRRRIRRGDMLVLRPGVWHGYERCRGLHIYNCCIGTGLLDHELAWTREDPLLAHLLWTGPMAAGRHGALAVTLDDATLTACRVHLDALNSLRTEPVERHRADIIGQLLLLAGLLATSTTASGRDPAARIVPTHRAVVHAMRLLESRLAHRWTLAELARELHLTPGYLVRLFRSSTGLPPMAYLARRRVEVASSRLLHTDEPITHIAHAVGWPDQNYFARRFKAHLGMSATAYRRTFAGSHAEQSPPPH
jgi:AraC family transcriptional regulator, L-rhamnose operon transcriptional activator RhaR